MWGGPHFALKVANTWNRTMMEIVSTQKQGRSGSLRENLQTYMELWEKYIKIQNIIIKINVNNIFIFIYCHITLRIKTELM